MWGDPPLTLFIVLHFIPCLRMYSAVPPVPHKVKFNFINCFARSTPSSLWPSLREINARPFVGNEFAMNDLLVCEGRGAVDVIDAAVIALADFKNPFANTQAAITDGGTANTNGDRGYVRLSKSGSTITVETCFDDQADGDDTACTTAGDTISNNIEVGS